MTGRFARRRVVMGPGAARAYDADEWRDAIALVERGEVDVEARADGRRVRFRRGDVVTLDGLAARALHNPGREAAVLLVVSRRLRAVR